jgi:response regulator NasT
MVRVMLVEDAQKDVGILKEALAVAGFDVVQAPSLATALLDQVAKTDPDVIIVATDSPTRDTLEQLSFVSARHPRPIVMFTEERDSAVIQAAVHAGVTAYIVAGLQADRVQPILDVAVARFERDRALRAELAQAQTRLAERKVIERAKGILMEQRKVSEDEAFRLMRKLAMDRNAKLLDIAQQIIDVTDLLS